MHHIALIDIVGARLLGYHKTVGLYDTSGSTLTAPQQRQLDQSSLAHAVVMASRTYRRAQLHDALPSCAYNAATKEVAGKWAIQFAGLGP